MAGERKLSTDVRGGKSVDQFMLRVGGGYHQIGRKSGEVFILEPRMPTSNTTKEVVSWLNLLTEKQKADSAPHQ